jgi:hypothetical protein
MPVIVGFPHTADAGTPKSATHDQPLNLPTIFSTFHNAPQLCLVYILLPDYAIRPIALFMLAPVLSIDVPAMRSLLMTHIATDSSGPPAFSARWYAPTCVAAMRCEKWLLSKAPAPRFRPRGNDLASAQHVIHLLSPRHLPHDFRTFRQYGRIKHLQEWFYVATLSTPSPDRQFLGCCATLT